MSCLSWHTSETVRSITVISTVVPGACSSMRPPLYIAIEMHILSLARDKYIWQNIALCTCTIFKLVYKFQIILWKSTKMITSLYLRTSLCPGCNYGIYHRQTLACLLDVTSPDDIHLASTRREYTSIERTPFTSILETIISSQMRTMSKHTYAHAYTQIYPCNFYI